MQDFHNIKSVDQLLKYAEDFHNIKSVDQLLKYAEDFQPYHNKLKQMIKSFVTLGNLNEIDNFITEVQEKYPDTWKYKLFDYTGISDMTGNTLIDVAIKTRNDDILNKILDIGPLVDGRHISKAMYNGFSSKTVEKMLDIISKSVNINTLNNAEMIVAIRTGYFELIPKIIYYTDDTNRDDSILAGLIHSTIGEGKYEVVDYILNSSKFHPYLTYKYTDAVINHCIKENKLDILRKLFDAGIEPTSEVIRSIENTEYSDVISLFKEYGFIDNEE